MPTSGWGSGDTWIPTRRATGARTEAWTASGQQHIRVFAPDGATFASYDVPAAANIRFGAIDANALRLYLGLYNGTCEIYDLSTGALQHSQSLGGTFDSHAFSADGTTFAYGNFSGLFVVRETLPGVWTQIASRFHAGSQFLGRCALSADGDVIAAGSKAVHANTFGNGGTAWCLDAAEQTLHILGDAQLGGTLEMTSPSGATQMWLAMAPALGQSPTAFGISELSLGGASQVFGPFAVGAGGALETLPMPSSPSLNGTAVHFQGLRVAGAPELTNKVSIRLYN